MRVSGSHVPHTFLISLCSSESKRPSALQSNGPGQIGEVSGTSEGLPGLPPIQNFRADGGNSKEKNQSGMSIRVHSQNLE